MRDYSLDVSTLAELPIVDLEADYAWHQAVVAAGNNPDNPWIGRYVDYQWERSRHVFESLHVNGKRVLEFGCHMGASSIVLAILGAKVTGIDVNKAWVRVAKQNAARYGYHDIEFGWVPNSTKLPFESGSFDIVTCISVLEYVSPSIMAKVQQELNRVLKPGGTILISGTSSRLWPREAHSRRWFLQYLPRFIGKNNQRGANPWTLRYGFGQNYVNLDRLDRGVAYLKARDAIYGSSVRRFVLRVINAIAQFCGTSPGFLMPNISVRLRK